MLVVLSQLVQSMVRASKPLSSSYEVEMLFFNEKSKRESALLRCECYFFKNLSGTEN